MGRNGVPVDDSAACTVESPAPGLSVWQPRRGFRYALDPFLLAGFALEGGVPSRFLDAGTGSGIAALLLARLGIPGEGIDIRPEWITMATRSRDESCDVHGAPLRLDLAVQDLRARDETPVELALMNPPYLPNGRGVLPRDPLRAAGRHELAGGLAELVPALARAARRVALIVPAHRGAELEALLVSAGRPPRRRLRVGDVLHLVEGRAVFVGEIEDTSCEAPRQGWFPERIRALYAAVGVRLPLPG